MAICEKCKKRNICKEICPELHKEISNHGISFRQKEKTYAVDFSLIEKSQFLNAFQLEVGKKIVHDKFLEETAWIDLEDLIQKHLSERQREAVQLLLQGYSQRKIASRMKISHQTVTRLIKKATRKLKYFFMEGGAKRPETPYYIWRDMKQQNDQIRTF